MPKTSVHYLLNNRLWKRYFPSVYSVLPFRLVALVLSPPCQNSKMSNNIGEKCDCDDCHLGELCDSECNGHGNCINGICSCLDNWQEDKCTRPGCPSMTSESCSGNGICMAGIGTCICDPGWSGQYNFINFSV